jgi:hypothetical protein
MKHTALLLGEARAMLRHLDRLGAQAAAGEVAVLRHITDARGAVEGLVGHLERQGKLHWVRDAAQRPG